MIEVLGNRNLNITTGMGSITLEGGTPPKNSSTVSDSNFVLNLATKLPGGGFSISAVGANSDITFVGYAAAPGVIPSSLRIGTHAGELFLISAGRNINSNSTLAPIFIQNSSTTGLTGSTSLQAAQDIFLNATNEYQLERFRWGHNWSR